MQVDVDADAVPLCYREDCVEMAVHIAIDTSRVETTDEMVEEVEATLLGDGTVENDDVLVIISGAPMWVTGTTNLLKLHRVGDRR